MHLLLRIAELNLARVVACRHLKLLRIAVLALVHVLGGVVASRNKLACALIEGIAELALLLVLGGVVGSRIILACALIEGIAELAWLLAWVVALWTAFWNTLTETSVGMGARIHRLAPLV